MNASTMVTLGIETSCDDTCVALLEGVAIRQNLLSSQVELHAAYGGVVPELAARAHAENILPLLDQAFSGAGMDRAEVDLVAVTGGPGLVGALLVGVSAAKALAWSWNIPLVGVNHVEAHIHAHRLDRPGVDLWPAVCLVVSGGHTDLLFVDRQGEVNVLGQTLDDAAGEAFDKVARLLELGYPGGPVIDRLSRDGDPRAVAFPRAWLAQDSLDFSYSGLKTAVAVHVERQGIPEGQDLHDLLASFQEAVVEVLVRKTLAASRKTGCRRILVAGGVAANSRLRELLSGQGGGEDVWFPPPHLCTDNAAMVAAAGAARWAGGGADGLDLEVNSSLTFANGRAGRGTGRGEKNRAT